MYVGLLPNTEFVDKKYKDEHGFLEIDSCNRLDENGLFAAGDCCADVYKQVVIACAEGAKCSYEVSHYLLSNS